MHLLTLKVGAISPPPADPWKNKLLMSLWTDYRFRYSDYHLLRASLRNPNKYRYGILLPPEEEPKIKSGSGNKVFKVPEGWLILTRRKKGWWYVYQDLQIQPIRLIPLIIRWRPDKGRLSLQINRDYVRLQLKRAKALSKKFWYGSKRKNERDYIKAVNNLTRELKEIDTFAYVHKATKWTYNKKLEWIVLDFLTSVLGLPRRIAKEKVEKYLVKF